MGVTLYLDKCSVTQYRGLTTTRESSRHRSIYYVVSWRTGLPINDLFSLWGSLQMQSIPYVWNHRKNDGNGLYSQNVISVSTIMIDTQMWKRYPVSIYKADDVRGHGVTCVTDELPQMCSTLNFLYVDHRLQVTPEKKIQ
jgi:hypothetical protein